MDPKNKLRPLNRRSFLQTAGKAGLTVGCAFASVEEDIADATQTVNRNSSPSDLKITDLRIAEITGAPMRVPIIKIGTNGQR